MSHPILTPMDILRSEHYPAENLKRQIALLQQELTWAIAFFRKEAEGARADAKYYEERFKALQKKYVRRD